MKINVNLESLAGGSVQKQFENAMQQVISNIKDPKTSHKKRRSVQLTISIAPTEDRKGAYVDVDTKTSLAPQQGASTQLWFEGATAEEREFEDLQVLA